MNERGGKKKTVDMKPKHKSLGSDGPLWVHRYRRSLKLERDFWGA